MNGPSLRVETGDTSLESTANLSVSLTNLPISSADSAVTDSNQPRLLNVDRQEGPSGAQSDLEPRETGRRFSATTHMPVQHTEVYSCQTSTDPAHPQSVQQLRDHYSRLDEAVKPCEKEERHTSRVQSRKTSYTISVGPIPTEPSEKTAEEITPSGVKSEHNSRSPSVEELRRLFESLPDRKFSRQNTLKRIDSSCEPFNRPEDTAVITTKSVEFYSRPPNVRTPSPQPRHVPTPQPLPLPPPNMSNCENYVSSHYHLPKYGPPKSQIELVVKPKSSKSLPFRSRSVVIEQSRNNVRCRSRDSSGLRNRRRQISASPTRLRGYKNDADCQTPTSTAIAYTARARHHDGPRCMAMAEQTPFRSVITVPQTNLQESENSPVITRPDGVYIRSAVVYERVPDRPETESEKKFVTTYIISTDSVPSPSTVQATNLWVAERSLMSSKQEQQRQLTLPPHRTQALSPVRFNTLPRVVSEQTLKRADSRCTAVNVEQAPHHSNYRREQERSQQTEVCSNLQPNDYNNKLGLRPDYTKSLPTGYHQRGRQRQRRNRSRLYRTWSVKSLSPPPFRSQWLSTLSNPKLNQIDGVFSPDPQVYSRPKDFHTDTEVYRSVETPTFLDRQRQREARDRRAWLRRAEMIGRKRLNYHQLRGSWSPPSQRSPPRDTPNNAEEPTETELRQYIRHNLPIPLVPREPAMLDQAVQTGGGLVNPTSRKHAVTQVNRFQSDIDESPITENFDEKCTYFEELIRSNKLLAQCSFCSDCYHCAPKRCSNHNSYSSWGSDLHVQQYRNPQEQIKTNQLTFYSPHQPIYLCKDDKNCGPNRSDDMWNFQDVKYTVPSHENVYMSQDSPMSFYPNSQFRRNFTQEAKYPKCSPHSIDYDYYAKPQVQMPKVAPNPPGYQAEGWNRVGRSYGHAAQAELIRSPMGVNDYPSPGAERENHRFIHSPTVYPKPYRFGNDRSQLCESSESLYCDQPSGTEVTYYGRGRVKHIASQLDNFISNSYQSQYGE